MEEGEEDEEDEDFEDDIDEDGAADEEPWNVCDSEGRQTVKTSLEDLPLCFVFLSVCEVCNQYKITSLL